jgi:hypothetical protein
MVTVDGVMQGLGAPDEDRRGGLERGAWQQLDLAMAAYVAGHVVRRHERAVLDSLRPGEPRRPDEWLGDVKE